ncbi:macrophage colony-stimulating factor 1 receptor 2-like, partial [Plectropomus leopardus]|uniref:macrophage colony-stimulating factor 1 receptor 2-like n=1 Tax=Plectropomus leopardus TaxID=160734 RepID=UPI001C4DA849
MSLPPPSPVSRSPGPPGPPGSPGPPGPPLIRLNSDFLRNQTEVVLTAGPACTLSCLGNGLISWTFTAFDLLYRNRSLNPVKVPQLTPRHTGTYRCGYTNQSLDHLHTWIHLYVKDPTDPSSVFVTPRRLPDFKEGEDFLFRCLLTDPSVTNLTLQSEDGVRARGRGLPSGMKVTFDPRRGALIQEVQVSFRGHYVCSGWRDGTQFKSKPVHLLVTPRLHRPPSVSVSEDEVVRLEGETFDVTCRASNPSYFYNLTWTHPQGEPLRVFESCSPGSCLRKTSMLRVPAVRLTDGGTYTCKAFNEAGVATETTHLRVL